MKTRLIEVYQLKESTLNLEDDEIETILDLIGVAPKDFDKMKLLRLRDKLLEPRSARFNAAKQADQTLGRNIDPSRKKW